MTDHPLFAHQLEAIRRRREIEDDLTVNGTLIRAGYRRRRGDEDQATPRVAGRRTGIDWWAPSPMITFPRDLSGVRSPHLSITPISKTVVPLSATGETHPDYPDQSSSVENHYGYIERQDGKDGMALSHGDYIERDDAREVDDTTGRASYVYSNISRNPNKRRAFARAVWDHEMTPRTHHLQSWVSHLSWWEELAKHAGAPAWVKDAVSLLRREAAKKTKDGKIPADRLVQICKVTQQEAYDRITWCEAQTGWNSRRKQVAFKCGPGGRVQYRIVYELPHGLSAAERMEIVRLMCRHLKQWGFMYVAAIHQPDAHNDPRNFHVHIDMYDRPCRFLKRFGKWDFQVTTRDRKGHVRRPYERKKVADFTRDPDARDHRAWGKKVITSFRHAFVEFTNEVLARGGHRIRYDARDFASRGVALTPTKKLHGKVTAAEKNGIRTPRGDINAALIWGDVFKALDRRRDEQLAETRQALAEIQKSVDRIPAGRDLDLITSKVVEYRQAEFELIERAHALEAGDAEVRMAMSRAETVLREVAKRAVSGAKSQGFKSGQLANMRADAQADAEQHLGFIRSLSPPQERVTDEREYIVAARLEVAAQRQELIAAAADLLNRPKGRTLEAPTAPAKEAPRIARKVDEGRAVVFDLRALASTRGPKPPGKFAELEIGRVVAWLNTHLRDAEAITFTADSLTLRPPTAVASLLIKHQSAPALRAWIGEAKLAQARASHPSRNRAEVEPAASNPTLDDEPRRDRGHAEKRRVERGPLDRGDGQRALSRLAKGPIAGGTGTGIGRGALDPAKLASIDAAVEALRAAIYPPQVRGPSGFALAPGYAAALEGANRWEAEKPIQDAHAAKWIEFLAGLKRTLERAERANPIGFRRGTPVVELQVLGRELNAAYAKVKNDDEVLSLLREVDVSTKRREKDRKERLELERRAAEEKRAVRLGRIQDALAKEERGVLATTPAQARQGVKVNMRVLEDAAAQELIARENGGPDPLLIFAGKHLEIIAAAIQALPGGTRYLTKLRTLLGSQVQGHISGTLPLTASHGNDETWAAIKAIVKQKDGGQGL